MFKTISTIFFMTLSLSALAYFHYPEDRNYTSTDRGYTQYGAPSLYKTGKYALTFDDGPHPIYSSKILDALKLASAKATFFILTSNVNEKTFPIVKRMLDEGHIVASHGYTHDNSNTVTREVWKARVKKSIIDVAALYKRAGHSFDKFYYRFPYAAYGQRADYHHMNVLKEISQELMGDNCIHFAFWDFDSSDWVPGMTADEVFSNFKASNEGGKYITYKTIKTKSGRTTQIKVRKDISSPNSGGIVLEHDIQHSSAEGITKILEYVASNNLEIVRLDEVEEFKITKNCRMKE
jgi:peptidoglycan/xylan/chitin deacetylase (PgdA/CDA1 family)